MGILEALNWRYAVKQFSDKKVSDLDLKQLMNAVCLSPSAYGLQPYKVLLIESAEIKNKLLPFSYEQEQVIQCSHLLVFTVDTELDNKIINRYIEQHMKIANISTDELEDYAELMRSDINNKTSEQRLEWAHQQAYIALGNLLTSAALMRIDSCPMSGIDFAAYDEILNLSVKNLTTSFICPIGYRHQDDVHANNPKIRFDYDDIVIVV